MTRKGGLALFVTLVILGGLAVGGYMAYHYLYERFTPARCTVVVDDHEVTLTREQARNASIIVAASVERGLPERAAIVALATAYQESGLRNLDYGDRDSLGLFQQRPSYGWGTEEEIMDPWYTSHRFYEELVKFDNWETTDINDMAQKVQRSGFRRPTASTPTTPPRWRAPSWGHRSRSAASASRWAPPRPRNSRRCWRPSGRNT